MEYNEWYEIHWRKHDNDADETTAGVRKFTLTDEHIVWDEFDAMRGDPDMFIVTMLRHSTVRLGYHSKGRTCKN